MNEAEAKAQQELEAAELEAAEREMLHVEHEMEAEMRQLQRDVAKAEATEKELEAPHDGREAW